MADGDIPPLSASVCASACGMTGWRMMVAAALGDDGAAGDDDLLAPTTAPPHCRLSLPADDGRLGRLAPLAS